MTTWTQLLDDAPELGALAQARIEASGLALLATLRRSPSTPATRRPPGPMHLFRLDVTEVSSVQPNTDHLVIQIWHEGEPVRRIERR